MKYLSIIFFLLFALLACKKDEEPSNLCSNGFLDIGETGIDCGGTCPDCPVVFTPQVTAQFNGVYTPFTNFSLTQVSGDWFLKFQNDTIETQFKIGQSLVEDSNYTLPTSNAFTIVNGISYSALANPNTNFPISVFGISEILAQEQRTSGLFQAIYYIPGTMDTMRVTHGSFTDVPF